MENQIKIDRVILSSDLNPQFLNFWPIAAQSWRTVFGINPTLVLVSRKPVEQKIMERLKEYGAVYSIVSTSKAPLPNQAKMARWYLAGKIENEMLTIEDIDTMYLSEHYLRDRFNYFQQGKLLGIGSDVNQEDPAYHGKFPASNLTGKSETFATLFGTDTSEIFEDFLDRFKGMKVIDDREDPFNNPKKFSDESLIRALRSSSQNNLVKVIPRNVDIHTQWMDRSWWPERGEIPERAILANLPRPLYNNQLRCRKLIKLHFKEEYPWMINRGSRIWENPDHPIRMKIDIFSTIVAQRFEKISQKMKREKL